MKLLIPLDIPNDLEITLSQIAHVTQLPRDEIMRLFLESCLLEAWADRKVRTALKKRFTQLFPETGNSWTVDMLFGEGSVRKTLPRGRRAA